MSNGALSHHLQHRTPPAKSKVTDRELQNSNMGLLFGRYKQLSHIQGVPKKRGISECHSVCSTAQLMLSLEFSFPIHLKIEIHTFVTSTEPFMSDVREQRNKLFKYRSDVNYLQVSSPLPL